MYCLTQFRSSNWRCSVKKGVLKNFATFTGKHLCWRIFLIKLLQLYYKETPTQVLPCEYCKIFKNTYFEKHLRMPASNNSFKYIYMVWKTSILLRFCLSPFKSMFRFYSSWKQKNSFPLSEKLKKGTLKWNGVITFLILNLCNPVFLTLTQQESDKFRLHFETKLETCRNHDNMRKNQSQKRYVSDPALVKWKPILLYITQN